MLFEKELLKVANSMLEAQLLRITRKASRDIERPAIHMDLFTTAQAVLPQGSSTAGQ